MSNSSILITGGTGSFGSALIKHLLRIEKFDRIVVFSRDELKQLNLKSNLGSDSRLRFFLGDIRDKDRLNRALNGIGTVIHAAALKQVDTGEYNPIEFVKTNIYGSNNIIEASLEQGVQKVVALSTDKASSPINLYGATKLTADKLFVAANNYVGQFETRFSVVRYGNVIGSRGSVVPFFRDLALKGQPLPITDARMTRFWITINSAVKFVLDSLDIMQGGELFVPKIPSMRIVDLAEAIAPNSKIEFIGTRPGEKLHEEMINPDESFRTYSAFDRYIVCPVAAHWGFREPNLDKVSEGFSYRSDTNEHWLSAKDLQKIISELP